MRESELRACICSAATNSKAQCRLFSGLLPLALPHQATSLPAPPLPVSTPGTGGRMTKGKAEGGMFAGLSR